MITVTPTLTLVNHARTQSMLCNEIHTRTYRTYANTWLTSIFATRPYGLACVCSVVSAFVHCWTEVRRQQTESCEILPRRVFASAVMVIMLPCTCCCRKLTLRADSFSVAVLQCKMRSLFVVVVLIAALVHQGTAQLPCKWCGSLLRSSGRIVLAIYHWLICFS